MKFTLEVDAEPSELEPLIRMLLLGQISDADVAKAKQREWNYQSAERSARVSQLFVEAHERNRQKRLAKEAAE